MEKARVTHRSRETTEKSEETSLCRRAAQVKVGLDRRAEAGEGSGAAGRARARSLPSRPPQRWFFGNFETEDRQRGPGRASGLFGNTAVTVQSSSGDGAAV